MVYYSKICGILKTGTRNLSNVVTILVACQPFHSDLVQNDAALTRTSVLQDGAIEKNVVVAVSSR